MNSKISSVTVKVEDVKAEIKADVAGLNSKIEDVSADVSGINVQVDGMIQKLD